MEAGARERAALELAQSLVPTVGAMGPLLELRLLPRMIRLILLLVVRPLLILLLESSLILLLLVWLLFGSEQTLNC